MSTPTNASSNSYMQRCSAFITSRPVKLWGELSPRSKVVLVSASAVFAIYALAKSLLLTRTWVSNLNKRRSEELGKRLVQELKPSEVRDKINEYKEALASAFLKTGALLHLDLDREEHYGIDSAGAEPSILVAELKNNLEQFKSDYQIWMAHNEVALRCTRVHEKSKEMVTPLPTELHEALVETAHIVDNSSELMSVLQMIESLEKIADVMAESWERPQELFTRTRELETRDLGFEELVDSVFSEKSFTDLTTSVCRAGVITQAEVKRLFTNLKPHVASVESHFTDDTIGDDVEARGDDRRENSIRSMQEVYDYLEKQCGHYSVFEIR